MKSKISGALNMKRLKEYLSFFKSLNAEAYLNGATDLDESFKNSTRSCQIEVETHKGDKKAIDIYLIHRSQEERQMSQGMPYDVERMYAVNLNTKDTLLIQNQTFDKILQSGSIFYQN
jgi:hypothetical protein